jgi:hypothetical protein
MGSVAHLVGLAPATIGAMTKGEALNRVAELERLTREFGWANTAALARIRAIASELRALPLGGYFREKLGDLEERAGIGLSARKWMAYAGGVDQVRVWAIASCQTMQNLIDRSSLPESE